MLIGHGAMDSVVVGLKMRALDYVLFNAQSNDVEQWQLLAAQRMQKDMDLEVFSKGRLLSRDLK